MSDVEARARSIVTEAAGKLSPIEHIKREVREMDGEDVMSLAVAYLYAQVKSRKRAQVREVEKSSSRKEPWIGAKSWEQWAQGREVTDDRLQEHRTARSEVEARELKESNAVIAKMALAIDTFASEMKMRWTAELLASEFAIGDGTKATWGEATVEQHRSRMAMHKSNAMAGMDGYARHAAAVRDLESTGARTLSEVTGVLV